MPIIFFMSDFIIIRHHANGTFGVNFYNFSKFFNSLINYFLILFITSSGSSMGVGSPWWRAGS